MNDDPNISDYDFCFEGYLPHWVPVEQFGSIAEPLFRSALGQHLVDIEGVIYGETWNPNWPLILRFSSTSLAIVTMCDYLWAINEWRDYPLQIDDEAAAYMRFGSVVDSVGLAHLIGKSLQRVAVLPVEQQGVCCDFAGQGLLISDGGDELWVESLDKKAIAQHFKRSTLLCSLEKEQSSILQVIGRWFKALR